MNSLAYILLIALTITQIDPITHGILILERKESNLNKIITVSGQILVSKQPCVWILGDEERCELGRGSARERMIQKGRLKRQ